MFKTIAEAHRYLVEQGFTLTDRTLANHIRQGLLGCDKDRRGRITNIDHKALMAYARAHLEKRGGGDVSVDCDIHEEIKRETLRKLRDENNRKAGLYLLKSEEEQRDAAVLAAFRRHLEAGSHERVQSILSDILGHPDMPDRLKSDLTARLPEYVHHDLEFLADMFDAFTRIAIPDPLEASTP
uniref:Uncharacterized protein n=1 Tax=Geobacter metallireducens TaxID=28232 RepID=A0A831UBU6_GEOME